MAISAIRIIIIYVFIIISMRIMGKRQIGEMQPAELVVTLLISDLAAVPMQERGTPLTDGLIPIMMLISLEILLSGFMLKIPLFQRLVSGKPKLVIIDGRIDQKALRAMRLTLEDMTESLRQQSVFDLSTIQYALVEPSGKISVLLYPGSRSATCEDLQLSPPDKGMPMIIISDGVVSQWGMQVCNLNQKWLNGILEKNKCDAADVFLMTADRSRAYTLMRKGESA